jgi:aldehyde dehydrogenase (NAD+)
MLLIKEFMNYVTETEIDQLLQGQRNFFATNATKDVKFRIAQLKKLKKVVNKYEQEIAEALKKDLNKSYEEAYLTEISIVNQEINYHLKHVRQWAALKRIETPIHLLPSSSYLMTEPLGVTLIVAPWNYPYQLLFNPLIGAISSGCCAMLKPSPFTVHISQVMDKIIKETFDPNYISIVHGSFDENQMLFKRRFDLIFFTGSPMLGKVVMKAAAEHLTPVILELGGKSPCIVDASASLDKTAKRIAWSKSINAGQTCIAPDYLLVHEKVKDALIAKIAAYWKEMYGADAQQSPYYPRIVRTEAVERLEKLMLHGKIVTGGKVDKAQRYIEPTIIDEVKADYPIMQEEIFGPILPVLTYQSLDEAIQFVNDREKPLALYFYGKESVGMDVFSRTSSGGGCINDGLMHIANHYLPFGGVGNSGMGAYHGEESFYAFSNRRGIVSSPTWPDLPFKYVPFKLFNLIRKII